MNSWGEVVESVAVLVRGGKVEGVSVGGVAAKVKFEKALMALPWRLWWVLNVSAPSSSPSLSSPSGLLK